MLNRQQQLHQQFREHTGLALSLASTTVLETAQLTMRQFLELLNMETGFNSVTTARSDIRYAIDHIITRRKEQAGYDPLTDEQIIILEEALKTF